MSLNKLPVSYVAMDLETTGLDSSKDGIVEIAGVKVRNGEVVATFQTYVDTDARMSAAASKVNGITRDMLKGAPKTDEAITSFLEFADGLPMLGHNAKAFDRLFLERACAFSSGAVAPSEWYDTMDIGKQVLGRKASLRDLCEHAGVTNEKAHSALSDAMATHECYQWLREEIAKTTTDARDFSPSSSGGPLSGEVVCFTGDCPLMPRHNLMELVSENGGSLSNSVTLKTTILVNFEGRQTTKARKAAEYAERTGIRTIDGPAFFKILDMPYDTAKADRSGSQPGNLDVHAQAEENRRIIAERVERQRAEERAKTASGCGGLVIVFIVVLVLLMLLFFVMCSR